MRRACSALPAAHHPVHGADRPLGLRRLARAVALQYRLHRRQQASLSERFVGFFGVPDVDDANLAVLLEVDVEGRP